MLDLQLGMCSIALCGKWNRQIICWFLFLQNLALMFVAMPGMKNQWFIDKHKSVAVKFF